MLEITRVKLCQETSKIQVHELGNDYAITSPKNAEKIFEKFL